MFVSADTLFQMSYSLHSYPLLFCGLHREVLSQLYSRGLISSKRPLVIAMEVGAAFAKKFAIQMNVFHNCEHANKQWWIYRIHTNADTFSILLTMIKLNVD